MLVHTGFDRYTGGFYYLQNMNVPHRGNLRGSHQTTLSQDVINWLLDYGDIAPGIIQGRSANNKAITVKQLPETGWITIKLMDGGVQELRFFPNTSDSSQSFPWYENNIPKKIARRYTITVDESLQENPPNNEPI